MAAGISLALLWRSVYILFLTTSLAATATSFSFFYNFSNPTTYGHGDLHFEGDAYMGDGSIILAQEQLTGNTTSRSGRVSYGYPIRLWSNESGEALGFSANFSFVINGSHSPPLDTGGGLAFFLAPYPSRMPPNSEGVYLGLFNSTTVGGGDGIVAVEVDTRRDHGWVPTTMSPHIAVDLNTLHSGKRSYRAVDDFVDGVPYVLQVDYSDVTKELLVLLRDSAAGVPLTALKKSVDLSMLLPRDVAMGISAATSSSNMATHHVLWWSLDTSTNRTYNLSSLEISAPDAPGTIVVPDSPPPADTTDPPSAGAGRRPILVGIIVFAVLATVTAAVVTLLCLLSRSSHGSNNSLGLSDDLLLPTSQRKIWRFSRMRDQILLLYGHLPNCSLSDLPHNTRRLLTWPMRYIALGVGSALQVVTATTSAVFAAVARESNEEIHRNNREETLPALAVEPSTPGADDDEDVTMDSLWDSIVQRRAERPVVVRRSESWANEELPRLKRVAKTAAARREMRKSVSAVSDTAAARQTGWRTRDVLPSPDDLLRRAESFIRRQREHLRLQRQESEQHQLQLQSRLHAPALVRI